MFMLHLSNFFKRILFDKGAEHLPEPTSKPERMTLSATYRVRRLPDERLPCNSIMTL